MQISIVSILILDLVNIETNAKINIERKIAREDSQEKIVWYGELCRHQENCDFRHKDNRQSNVASVSKIDNLSRTVKLIQNNIVG